MTFKNLREEDLETERKVLTRFINHNELEFIFPEFDWENDPIKSEAMAFCRIGIKYLHYLGKKQGFDYLSKSIEKYPTIEGLINSVELLIAANLNNVAKLLISEFKNKPFMLQ